MQQTKDKSKTQQRQKRELKKKKKRRNSLTKFHEARRRKKKLEFQAELDNLLQSASLKRYAEATQVDHQVKKLTGLRMLTLMVFCLTMNKKLSQRILADTFNSRSFSVYSDTDRIQVKHGGIGARLKTIKVAYFKLVFDHVYQHYVKQLPARYQGFDIVSFDSTMVQIYSKKLGMCVGNKPKKGKRKRQMKFSVGKKGLFPNSVRFYGKQSELSENIALLKAVKDYSSHDKEISVFDRGINKRLALAEFKEKGRHIVCRVNNNIRYQFLREYAKVKGLKTKTGLVIESDSIIRLYYKNRCLKPAMRLVIAKNEETGEVISFLTTFTEHFSAIDICNIYKLRWEIEVFFRFIKQELGFSHLISNSENGIKFFVYNVLIIAIMTIAYNAKKQLNSLVISKEKMKEELRQSITKKTLIRLRNKNDIYCQLYLDDLLDITLE